MKNIFFFVVLISAVNTAFAASDTIIIYKDARLDMLAQKQAQINKRSAMLTSNGQYKGYRVQIMSSSNRDDAFKMKADLLSKFPEEKSYIIFQSPNFKVRIGNCLKKDDAEKLRTKISKFFPQGVYIVEDAIEYTPTDEENNQ
jgi:hypothetical protein